jgi:predicted RNase H-like HicB family nuclease
MERWSRGLAVTAERTGSRHSCGSAGCLVDAQPGGYITSVTFTIELEREEDGRWIAEVPALPGVLCYGQDRDEAVAGVQALALRVIAERLENREAPAEFLNVTFQAA